jgi:hypothetical protein
MLLPLPRTGKRDPRRTNRQRQRSPPSVQRQVPSLRHGRPETNLTLFDHSFHIHLRGFFSSITAHVAAAVIPPSATSSKTSSAVPIGVILATRVRPLTRTHVRLRPAASGRQPPPLGCVAFCADEKEVAWSHCAMFQRVLALWAIGCDMKRPELVALFGGGAAA